MRALRRHWPLLALAAAAIWPLHDAVFAGRVLYYRDIHLAWYPAVEAFVRAVAQGSWPLWDPAPAFGQPLLAGPSSMVAYPPTWLNLVMPPWFYYALFAVTHLWWSALGTYLLCRRWRCSAAAATGAACLWCLSGPALSLVSLYHHFASACWIPWIFLTAERALLTRRRRHVVAWGVAMAAQALAGSADMTAMTWLAVAAYAATRLLRWRAPLSRRNRAMVLSAVMAVVLAIALSAIVWLPASELVARSARRELPMDTRTYWSLHPLGLLEAWLPGLWHLRGLRPSLSAVLFEGREPFLESIYLGIATIPLVAAAFAGRRPRRGILGAVAAASLLVALGRHFVAYSTATTLLPPLSILRYPVKTFVMFAWVWALLCGQGIEAWRRRRGSSRAWALTAMAGAAVTAAAVGAASWLHFGHRAAAALLLEDAAEAVVAGKAWALLVAAAVAATATALAVVRWRQPARGARLAAAAVVVALLDLFAYGPGINPTAPRHLYARPPIVDLLRVRGAQRLHSYTYSFGGHPRKLRYARVPSLAAVPEGWSRQAAGALAQQMSLVPNTPGRWGLESGFEADPTGLFPDEVAELTGLLPLVDGTPLLSRLLRVGGITHVLSLDAMPELRPLAVVPVLLESPLLVYELPQPLPRAYAVGGSRAGADAGALLDPGFDPLAEVVLDSDAPALAGPPGRAGRVAIEQRKADRVTLTADMDREGYLVLLDAYDPGWHVRVDGQRQPLARANRCFRAVRLAAGPHRVEMVYRPWRVSVGAAITLVAAAAAALSLRPVRRRSSGPSAAAPATAVA